MSKPLLVLDTNVVLDLLYFEDAAALPLLHALARGRLRCVKTHAMLEELRRVLAYPGFALASAQQATILEAYQALSLTVEAGAAGAGLPQCSDPDDQKFIELAFAARVQGLVSKDRALLKLHRRCAPQFRIMTPIEAVRWLADVPALCPCREITPARPAETCAAPLHSLPAPPGD